MLSEFLFEGREGICLRAMTGACLEDFARTGAYEAVATDLLGSGGLEEKRKAVIASVVCGAGGARRRGSVGDLEVSGGGGDEVGGNLAVDGDQGGFASRLVRFCDYVADGVEGRCEGSLEVRQGVSVASCLSWMSQSRFRGFAILYSQRQPLRLT